MADAADSTPIYVVRYSHRGEVIDVSSRGETGKAAFDSYMNRLKSWGKNPKDYKFISARRVPTENR